MIWWGPYLLTCCNSSLTPCLLKLIRNPGLIRGHVLIWILIVQSQNNKITEGGCHSPTSCSLIFPFKFPNAIILWQGDKAKTLYEEYSASLSNSVHWSSGSKQSVLGLEGETSWFSAIFFCLIQVYLYRHLGIKVKKNMLSRPIFKTSTGLKISKCHLRLW